MKTIKCIAKIIFAIIFFGIAIVSIQEMIIIKSDEIKYQNVTLSDKEFRAEFFSDNQLRMKHLYSKECRTILSYVENDVSYFPVAELAGDKSSRMNYNNSWMLERTFGGKRGHEGVDILSPVNKSGMYPIISMTNGVITNLGWLEKGGYRVGITSDSGIYYYYAHLSSYFNLKEGQRVKAGEMLGYMGDSGYGPEGTTGKFPVHLHVGIYVYKDGQEISLNPYYVLLSLKKKVYFK